MLLLLFSHSVVSNPLRPCGLQHARLPCPSPSSRAYSNSCPSSWWCQPIISSSVIPFSSCPQSFPGSESFSSELVLCNKWPKYWSFSVSPSNEYSLLISFRIDWFGLLAVQGTLKSLLQDHSLKASVLQFSALLIVQLSYPYMTTGKTKALARQTFVGKVTALLFNILARLIIAFLPRSKCLLISWLQSPSAVILEPKKIRCVMSQNQPQFLCAQWLDCVQHFANPWTVAYPPSSSVLGISQARTLECVTISFSNEGQLPWQFQSEGEWIRAQISSKLPNSNPGVPPALYVVLQSGLATILILNITLMVFSTQNYRGIYVRQMYRKHVVLCLGYNQSFWTVVLEKTLQSLLDCKEIQPVHPKGDQSWIFIGRTDVEAETPILCLPDVKSRLFWKDPDAGKDWRWRRRGQQRMR